MSTLKLSARLTGLLVAALLQACGQTPDAGASIYNINSAPSPANAGAQNCTPDPLPGRTLYLRGTFNSWNAVETQKFTWACQSYELVSRLEGEHRFKVGDEAWSADADFGGSLQALQPRGPEISQRFEPGTYRLTLTMAQPVPQLKIDTCPQPAPHGDKVLFLRGTPNNWAALDSYAFQYSCDAYYLNLKLQGRHEFKVADAAWTRATSFGASADQRANFAHDFNGEHTVRLAFVAGRAQVSVGAKSFADPTAQPVTDPVALSLRFDSRDAAHKQPFGALPRGSTVNYAVTVLPGVDQLTLVVEQRLLEGNQERLDYTETARIPMQRQAAGVDGREQWAASHRFDTVAIHGWWFEARIGGRLFVLQNNADAVYWTREKGSGGRAAVADMPRNLSGIRRLRQTIYDPAFQVPDWAADVVYYYVFPERFRNGDPSNDPVPGRDKYRSTTVEKHARWGGQPYKPGSGDGSDDTYNNDFFGGDLAGLIDKLDAIRELGANTIYMTPVFKAGSNHKYDTADYREIDPAFGSNADFERLTREATRRGLRVIVDASLNHTGSDSVYFNRYGNQAGRGAFQNGKIDPGSPYFSWYKFDPTQTDPDRQYTGWVGVTDLPELDKASPGWRQYAYGAPDSVMKLWLDRGAAGWRMDVAPWVPDDFWREWRSAIKTHSPDALTVAETWFDSSKYFLGDMFDSTMNYIFRNAVLDYAAGGDALAMVANLELMREAYPPQAHGALMNLLSTHDQARSLHVFGWSAQHGNLADAAAEARAKQRLKLALFFQMTYPGAPTVYYGDEVGVSGGDDPYNRAPYPWADQGGQPDLALRAEFKRLIALRHAHPVLRRGSVQAPLLADRHVVVQLRRLGTQWALVATNNADTPRTVRVPLPADAPAAWRDALVGSGLNASGAALELTLPALGAQLMLAP